ncbi:MAG: ATP-dependent Clp protease adaptor ClpS [Psychroflexus halocasei]|uniref:ATP-dependent Clp protease adaptor ClpS n=1 Tax=Psychroflexus sp. S27 TaxID=1982757 RepID=UPI000C2ADB7B|nr:ATP-dependent Clp protease adaptor ClpS [Psychroflexus sp. S27]PJX23675.1 Clp protease ClpS [Psychroflexus sp. S27]
MSTKEKTQKKTKVETQKASENEIVVFNDDYNTFDHVIETLIATCDHSPTQAEQCTIIIHYKGKCGVKSGSYEELKPRCLEILDAGISAEII